MFARIRITILLICSLSFPASLAAQRPDNLPKQKEDFQEELDFVINESQKLTPALANVLVRSKAASLLALRDPARADEMFLEVWNFALQQTDPDFDREQALNTILKNLFPKNAKLAKRLLNERLQAENTKEENSSKNDSKLVRLSSELADAEPSTASAYLESALSRGVTPIGLNALQRLRQTDPLLSDFVVSRVLDPLATTRTLTSLQSFALLSSYVFPEGQTFALPTEYEAALESLQFKYFATAYDVFRRSVTENEVLLKQNIYSPTELKTRSAYQAQLGVILAALAPRYHPAAVNELNSVSGKLMTQLSGTVALIAKFSAARLSSHPVNIDNPELSIPVAISSGNFQEASQQIDRLKREDQREAFTQLLLRVQAKAAMAKASLHDALTFIRRMKDSDAKLILYMEAGKLARKKEQADISRTIISEARTMIPQTDRNGLHCRALLIFSAQLARSGATQEAFEFLDAAVLTLNGLAARSSDTEKPTTSLEAAWAQVNDPQFMATQPEFELSFSLLGRIDSQMALAEAAKIKHKPGQFIARLAVIQEPLKRVKPIDVKSGSVQPTAAAGKE